MKKFLALLILLQSQVASAVTLSPVATYCLAHKDECRKGSMSLLAAEGSDGLQYVMQVDQTTGNLPVSASVTLANDTNYGTVGASTLRTAAQIGNATGAADFGAGNKGSQTLRTVIATDQTAIPASQSGTWTVQPGNTANTTPWLSTISQGGNSATVTAGNALKVDGSGVTQPISAASLPLPTGASTAAKQPSLGTAGTASSDVITVQGIASMTALKVDGSAVTQPVSGTVTANQGGAPWAENITQIGGTNVGVTNPLAVQLSNGTGAVTVITNGGTRVLGTAMYDSAGTGLTSVTIGGTHQSLDVNVANTPSVAQSGTWTVQPGNTANTTPWLSTISQGGNSASVTGANALKVDGSAVTQPISAASLPLPTGASTSAKQPALGTAGTASSDVITIQGIASMTAVKVDGSAVTQPVSGTVTANAGTGTFTTDQTTSAATFQAEGNLAFGSITTSYATIFTAGGSMKIISARNNTNGTISVSLDGGTTTHYVLDPGDAFSLDLKSNGLNIANTTAIQVKYTGSAPTSGSMRVNGVR